MNDNLHSQLADDYNFEVENRHKLQAKLQQLESEIERLKAENEAMREGVIRYLKACSSHIASDWVNHLMEVGGIDWHPPYDFKPKAISHENREQQG